MSFPMYTQGELKATIESMNIGDYIAAEYETTAYTKVGTINALGDVNPDLADYSSSNLNGIVYFMKLDKGLLVPCHQLGNGISYYTLAGENYVYGKKITLNSKDFMLRLPTSNEFKLMGSSLGGVLDNTHATDQFGSGAELVANINKEAKNGTMNVSSISSVTYVATNTTTSAFRLVLGYVDNPNSTDLYH